MSCLLGTGGTGFSLKHKATSPLCSYLTTSECTEAHSSPGVLPCVSTAYNGRSSCSACSSHMLLCSLGNAGTVLQAIFTGEAKGAREATKQLMEQVQALGAAASGSETKVTSVHKELRLLEKRQQEQQSAVAARAGEAISRQQMQARKQWRYFRQSATP